MALPVAHFAVGFGATRSRDPLVLLLLAVSSVMADFDFALVWGLGWPIQEFHRTFSHSLFFALAAAALYALLRPQRLRSISPPLVFAVLASHSALDMLCTANAADHGVELFWPFWEIRLGWPILVPLYQLFADSPFAVSGALRFTALEMMIAVPLWAVSRGFFLLGEKTIAKCRALKPAPRELMLEPQPEPE